MAGRGFHRVLVVGLIAGVAAGVVWLCSGLFANDYTVRVVLPASNPNLHEGMPFYMNGFKAGEVEEIRPQNNRAMLTLSLPEERAPLHSGAAVRVAWKSVFGERLLHVVDGAESNPPIPDGGSMRGEFPRPTEVGDVLAAFDPQTRDALSSLVGRLDDTVHGKERQLNRTLISAGPALGAIGEVLRGVGADGPAINGLVRDLNQLMATIQRRNPDVEQSVQSLSRATAAVAGERERLRAGLQRLPGTLERARSTLARVPAATERTLPLLDDLRAATSRLPSVSTKLAPLLGDLRPLVAELKPTLQATSLLLDKTPPLLDTAHATLPGLTSAARGYLPALDSLRPYTPEAVGWLTTWGSAAQNYDANGRYARILFQQGGTSFNANPGILPPGVDRDERPDPGEADDVSPSGADGEEMN